MKKYIYFSNKSYNKLSDSEIDKIKSSMNHESESIIWFIVLGRVMTVEVVYYKESEVESLTFLSKHRLYKKDLRYISYIENNIIEIKDKLFDNICVILIEDLTKYIEIINILNKDSEFIFRGQKDKNFSLQASVFRNNYSNDKEYNIYKEIKRNRFKDFIKEDFLDNLIHMQHYNIPTRLLDWSTNPLISIFFACFDPKLDGKVFMYSPDVIYEFDSPYYRIVSNYLKEDFNRESLSNESINFLTSIFREPFPIFIQSSLENERLRAQRGLFSINIDIRSEYLTRIKQIIVESTKLYKDLISENSSNNKGIDLLKSIILLDRDKFNLNISTLNDKKIILGSKQFIKELEKENFFDYTNNYETTLNFRSINFIISKENKQKIKKQLESLDINAMTVYPDFSGFVQYIEDKYER